jgi:hypothetical protein
MGQQLQNFVNYIHNSTLRKKVLRLVLRQIKKGLGIKLDIFV